MLLKDVIDIIRLDECMYSLCGVILFEPPLLEIFEGHFMTAVKTLNSWIVYDDRKKSTYTCPEIKEVIISSMLYIKQHSPTSF